MTKTDPQELMVCIDRIEELGTDVAWSFTKITNTQHAFVPGGGYGVQISGGTPEHRVSVWDGGRTLTAATDRAFTRYQRGVEQYA